MTTTTTTMNRPERVKLDHCPPWCAGHDGAGYQPWEDYDDHQERSHESEGVLIVERGVEDVTVAVCRIEDALGTLSTPTVTLYACSRMDLTPSEARHLASVLLEEADRAGEQVPGSLTERLERARR